MEKTPLNNWKEKKYLLRTIGKGKVTKYIPVGDCLVIGWRFISRITISFIYVHKKVGDQNNVFVFFVSVVLGKF